LGRRLTPLLPRYLRPWKVLLFLYTVFKILTVQYNPNKLQKVIGQLWHTNLNYFLFCASASRMHILSILVITSGSRGGGRTWRPPLLTAADLWYFNAQNVNFSHFSSLDSLAINFKHKFNRNRTKTHFKNDLNFNLQHLQ